VDELTIVLPLKDRVAYTARWMEYANYVKLPFPILIADGGSDDSARRLLSDRSRFSNLTYEYIRYPHDENYRAYYSKILDAVNRVETPFATMADNDDFLIADCMLECVKFLKAHPDYIGCGGIEGICWLSPSPIGSRPEVPLYSGDVAWRCKRGTPSMEEKTAKERLSADHMEGSGTYYDVKRTEELRRLFHIVFDLNLCDLFLFEWLVSFLTCIDGKTKRLNRLYLVRQQDSSGSSGALHDAQFGYWFGRMLVDSWSEDFNKFLSSVSNSLARMDNISEVEAREHVIKLYRLAVAPLVLSDLLDEPKIGIIAPSVFALARHLVRLPEGALKRIARKIYRNFKVVALDTQTFQVFRKPLAGANRDMKSVLAFLAKRS